VESVGKICELCEQVNKKERSPRERHMSNQSATHLEHEVETRARRGRRMTSVGGDGGGVLLR
jgi:hypothetical protein